MTQIWKIVNNILTFDGVIARIVDKLVFEQNASVTSATFTSSRNARERRLANQDYLVPVHIQWNAALELGPYAKHLNVLIQNEVLLMIENCK